MTGRVDHSELVGRPFRIGRSDCYSLIRDFYSKEFDIKMRNYARPRDYDIMTYSMYEQYAEAEGFEPFVGGYADVKYGDIFLMNINADFINHAGVYIGGGDMLHHFWGRLSEISKYGGLWMTHTMGIMRHKLLKNYKVPTTKLDALEALPAHVRTRIEAARAISGDGTGEGGNPRFEG